MSSAVNFSIFQWSMSSVSHACQQIRTLVLAEALVLVLHAISAVFCFSGHGGAGPTIFRLPKTMHTPLIPVGALADWGHRSGCAQCDTTHTDNRDASDALYELVRRDEAHIEELSTPRGMAHAQCNEPRTTTTPKIGRSFDRLTRTTLDTHNIRLYARANIRTSLPLWLLVLPHVVTDESVWLGGSVDNPTPFWDPNMVRIC